MIRRRWLIPLGIAALAAVVFLPALGNDFVSWDDDKNFLANPDYRGLGPANLRWMWTTFLLGHWVPLSWMTLGLDYTLWGMNPAGYHATNIVLHAANTVVLFHVAVRLLHLSRAGDERRITAIAIVAALLFAVHPLRVESVVWITERRDVLSGLLYSACILAYLKWNDGRANDGRAYDGRAYDGRAYDGRAYDGRANDGRWYWITLVLFAAALLSKGTSVTLPAVLLILEVYPLRRLGGNVGWVTPAARRVYLSLVPFVVLAGAFSVMTLVALQTMPQLSVAGKTAVSAYSVAFYLWKTLLPSGLSPLYPMPARVDPLESRYLAGFVVTIALLAFAWLARRRWPGAVAALAVFAAVSFPMLGFHQNGPQITADRYTYHAAPALTLIAAAALFALPYWRAITVAAVLASTLGALTWRQTLVWRDSHSLWTHALRLDEENPVAHSNLGNLLLERDSVDAAMVHYRKALSIAPGSAQTHNHLGVAHSRRGEFQEAVQRFEIATRIERDYDEPYSNWGATLAAQGDLEGAITQYQRALALNANNAAAQVNWGNALVRLNRPTDAIPHYQAALRIRPEYADAHHNWGVALARQNDFSGAIAQFRAALALSPARADTREYLDIATRLSQGNR